MKGDLHGGGLDRARSSVIAVVAVGFSLTYLFTAYRGPLDLFLHRSLFLLFALVLIFLRHPLPGLGGRLADLGLIGLTLLGVGNIVLDYAAIAYQAGIPTPAQVALGVLVVLIVFEASRRTIGLTLPILSLVAIAYAYFGHHIPGVFGHGGYSFPDIIGYLYITPDGLWGIPLGVAATYILVFIVLGSFLLRTGLADFFNGLALRLLGRLRGGPAQVAVWGSAAFGMVSGAAPANVAVTGSVTIPLMKRMGFAPGLAGAVECAASAGGQIMPPIMGAAIFIMIDLLGVSYGEVITAAFVPALLYFLGIGASVYFVASYLGLRGLSRQEIDAQSPGLPLLWRRGYLLVPLAALVGLVFLDVPVPRAAFYATLLTAAVALVVRRQRFRPTDIGRALQDGAEKTLAVTMGIACSAIIYAVIVFTGLGVKFSTLVVQAIGGNMLLLLVVSAAAALVLGAALPTTASYLIAAATIVPALTAVGVDPLAAHLFIFYYSVLATITPPEGMALYTAAGLAGASWLEVGLFGMRLTLSGFLVPFAFVYMPGLLMNGSAGEIVVQVASVVLGILALSAGLMGYMLTPLRLPVRVLLILAASLLFYPNLPTSLAGMLGVAAIALLQWRLARGVAPRQA